MTGRRIVMLSWLSVMIGEMLLLLPDKLILRVAALIGVKRSAVRSGEFSRKSSEDSTLILTSWRRRLQVTGFLRNITGLRNLAELHVVHRGQVEVSLSGNCRKLHRKNKLALIQSRL